MAKSNPEPAVVADHDGVDRVYAEHKAKELGVSASDIIAAIESLKNTPRAPKSEGQTLSQWLDEGEPATVYYRLHPFENAITGEPLRRPVGRVKHRREDGRAIRVREQVRMRFEPLIGPATAIFLGFPVLRMDVANAVGMAITPDDVAVYPSAKPNGFDEKPEYYTLRRVMELMPDERWFKMERASGLLLTSTEFKDVVRVRYEAFLLELRAWERSERRTPRPVLRPYTPKEFGISDMCLDRPPNVHAGGVLLTEPSGTVKSLEALS